MKRTLSDPVTTTIRLERFILQCARTLEINISQAAREGLELAISRKIGLNGNICSPSAPKNTAPERGNGTDETNLRYSREEGTGTTSAPEKPRLAEDPAAVYRETRLLPGPGGRTGTGRFPDRPDVTPAVLPGTDRLPPGIREEFLEFMALRHQQGTEEHEERIRLMRVLRRTAEEKRMLLQKQEEEARINAEARRAENRREEKMQEENERLRSVQTENRIREELDRKTRAETLLSQFSAVADRSLSGEEVILFRDRMLDFRHRMMNLPSVRGDADRNTKQALLDQYRAFLISVCGRAGFVFENRRDPDQRQNELLREVVEEYIFERAFQAESLEEETEQSGRDFPDTNNEKNSTTDAERDRGGASFPQNGYPAVTSPENTGQHQSCQERA